MACTDEQQRWNEGTSRNVEAKQLRHVNFKRKKAAAPLELQPSAAPEDEPPPLKQFLTREELALHVQQSPVASLMKHGLVGKVFNARLKDPRPVNAATPVVVHGDHNIDTDGCSLCRDFYTEHIDLGLQKAIDLESKTREQAGSDLWIDARCVRLTASTAGNVPVREATDSSKFLCSHIYHTFK